MLETRTAKLFKNGASQAVRLPADFRFDGDEVFATRDPVTGDVTLSAQPGRSAWNRFFDLAGSVKDEPDFMSDRPMNVPAVDRHLFDDEL